MVFCYATSFACAATLDDGGQGSMGTGQPLGNKTTPTRDDDSGQLVQCYTTLNSFGME